MLWPGAQQQPSGNGPRLLRELPVHFAIDYRGWTPPSHPHFFPLVLPCSSLPQSEGLHVCMALSVLPNCLDVDTVITRVSNTLVLQKHS